MQNGAEGSANVPADKEAGRTADVADAHGSLRRCLGTDPSAVGNRSESYGQGIVYGPPKRYPGNFPDGQLRTLQRRVQQHRREQLYSSQSIQGGWTNLIPQAQ